MLMVLLLLGCIAGYCAWLARTFRWPPATLPLFTLCSILLFLYIAALGGLLRPASHAVLAGGLILLGASLLGRQRRALLAALAEPGLAIWLVVGALLWPKLSTAAYGNWDEFTHWGRVSKEVYLRNGLVPATSDLYCKDYPPGTSLLHYFAASTMGYSEAKTYYAHDLLLLAAVVSLLQYVEWRRWGAVVVGLAFSYWALFTLGLGLSSLYVDHVLGVLAGAAIGQYWVSRERNDGGVWRIVPLVACLPLIKEMGLLLAAVATGIVVVDRAYLAIRGWHERAPDPPVSRRAGYAPVGALVLLPLLVHASWGYRLHAEGIGQTFTFRASPSQIARGLLRPQDDPFRERIVTSFGDALRRQDLFGAGARGSLIAGVLPPGIGRGNVLRRGWRFTVATAALVLTLIGVVNALVEPNARERWRHALAGLGLALGAAGYLATLLAAYAYAFSEYEGSRLVSLERYAGTYLLAWALACVATLVGGLRRTGYGRMVTLGVCWTMAVVALLTLPGTSIRFLLRPVPGVSDSRAAIQHAVSPLAEGAPPDAKVYHFWQNTDGFFHRISTYELTPRSSNWWCWTIGEPYGEGDVWTCRMSADELASRLREFDYVFVGHGDAPFWQGYGTLFEGPDDARTDGTIWQVERIGDGVRLRRWPRAPPS